MVLVVGLLCYIALGFLLFYSIRSLVLYIKKKRKEYKV